MQKMLKDRVSLYVQRGVCLLSVLFFVCLFPGCTRGINWIDSTAHEVILEKSLGIAYGEPQQLIKTADGGYAFVGTFGGAAFLVKTDAKGEVQWQREFTSPTPPRQHHSANAVLQTKDGGFLIAGSTDSDSTTGVQMGETPNPTSPRRGQAALVVKYDTNGQFVWKKTFIGTPNTYFNRVFYRGVVAQDGYILIGQTNLTLFDQPTPSGRGGSIPLWVVKLNDAGEVMWERVFGNEVFAVVGSGTEVYGKPVVDSQGNLLIAIATREQLNRVADGKLEVFKGGESLVEYAVVLKLDKDGHELKRVQLAAARTLAFTPIPQGYVLVGSGAQFHSKGKTWMVKLNDDLTIASKTIWETTQFGARCMVPLGSDDGLLIGGSHKADEKSGRPPQAATGYVTKEGQFQEEMMSNSYHVRAVDVVPGSQDGEFVFLVDSGTGTQPGAALVKVKRW